ncbi:MULTISPECIES: hypothetical protein [unclassified Leptolyngbya]|uniref:hypothetical protein n=1 Tax=unclassified Leptolyngbya TaxID=2650499 RepID=UPI0016840272|nr:MULTISPECIES: hypothetical protein [unclassified Leptolyngbya]MBD1910209.1 hypothetical protein [Leptolyngbya sp. FACHB-8]MBD2153403.1 hypothetical protein [Leptolyngbya sp. FACHB-16]
MKSTPNINALIERTCVSPELNCSQVHLSCGGGRAEDLVFSSPTAVTVLGEPAINERLLEGSIFDP